jgi:hypothetical protein
MLRVSEAAWWLGLQENQSAPMASKPLAPITSRVPAVMDGVKALDAGLRRAGYASVAAAVAEHTLFLHPKTVDGTHCQPVFPVIRDMARRGQFGSLPDGRRLLLDDNTTPTWTFLWAAGRNKGPDVQYNHVWTDAQNPDLYTALWNICATPGVPCEDYGRSEPYRSASSPAVSRVPAVRSSSARPDSASEA